MTSETDSSRSSSSSEEFKKRKANKKHKKSSSKKHKKQKKEKKHKHKHKKRSPQEVTSSTELKNVLLSTVSIAETAAFGPALPPNLQQQRELEADNSTQLKIIGPVMPSDLEKPNKTMKADVNSELKDKPCLMEEDINEEIGMYGPIPVTSAENTHMSATQIELEKRALELKLAAIEGINTQTVEQKVREEWMLELPEVGLKSGLAALSNMKRTFHQGKERPDFSDRSVWTKNPLGEESCSTASSSKTTVETLKQNAQANYDRKRDEEQESMAKKHKKKHKREESLVDMHQKKLRKEQKRKLKELKAAGAKPERRPFSRDVDLKLNKIDKDRTKQIVGKAKILDSKFSSGNTKYL